MAFSAEDIVPDSPTNNFATLNILNKDSDLTISNGNLEVTSSTSASHSNVLGNILADGNNKFYIELTFSVALSGTTAFAFYLADPTFTVLNTHPQSSSSGAWGFYGSTGGNLIANGASIASVTNPTTNSILQLVYNSSTGDGWVGFNDVYFDSSGGTTGSPNTNQNPTFTNLPNNLTIGVDVIGSQILKLNFGQDPTFGGAKSPTTTYTDANGIGAFYYPPPAGFKSLCTANLTDLTPTVIDDVPQDYFKAVKWTGQTTGEDMTWDGTTGTVNVGFQPDLVWVKARTAANWNALVDSVRGSTKVLSSNSTVGEDTVDSGNGVVFNANGFTVDPASDWNSLNSSGTNIVAWCWKAGGAPDLTSSPTKPFAKNGVQYETLSAANITAGTITPTAMSVNTDAGFSIVKYEGNSTSGSTLPHGLSQRPDMVILKNLDTTAHWKVWHNVLPTSGTPIDEMALNLTGGAGLGNNNFRGIGLQLITLGDNTQSNNSSYNYIAYCWHSVEGYSKFGSYTGNGSPDGPFVYCGFRPAFVMVKNAGQAANWVMYDNKRNTSNLTNKKLAANLSYEENEVATLGDDSIGIDLLSNGFKIRTTGPNHNNSNINYIFMAFSEQPFKFSNAR